MSQKRHFSLFFRHIFTIFIDFKVCKTNLNKIFNLKTYFYLYFFCYIIYLKKGVNILRILIFIICCFLLLAGCNNSPVADETNSGDTNAVETNTNGVNTEGSNSEKTNPSETTDSDSPDSEEKWPTIEVERPNMEPLHVSLDLLPEVKNALKETNDTPDRLNTTYLFERNYEYFILGYSCGSTMCNWVLVQYDPTLDSARTLDLSVFAGGHDCGGT